MTLPRFFHYRAAFDASFWFLHSLGKTLQSITLLYTLICQGFDGKPMVRKAIIVTPTSLVSNWEAEIKKWVGERIHLVVLCESTREDVVSGIDNFTSTRSTLQVKFPIILLLLRYLALNYTCTLYSVNISRFAGAHCFI